jgi:uncharacterized protein YegP (UPF0339 family)
MHFTIWRSRDGQYYWEAVGDNNETMAVSETYGAKASAQHAIDVIRREAADATVLDCADGSRFNRSLP